MFNLYSQPYADTISKNNVSKHNVLAFISGEIVQDLQLKNSWVHHTGDMLWICVLLGQVDVVGEKIVLKN